MLWRLWCYMSFCGSIRGHRRGDLMYLRPRWRAEVVEPVHLVERAKQALTNVAFKAASNRGTWCTNADTCHRKM